MNYGNKMKEIRIENKIMQKDIANYLGISSITYSHYETEDTTIPIKHLYNFCNYFNVSLDYILNLTNKKSNNFNNQKLNKITSGSRLKEFRKEQKLTQGKLASVINSDKTVICAYEKGKNIIATPFLYTICKKYNISADYLLGRTDNPKYIKQLKK